KVESRRRQAPRGGKGSGWWMHGAGCLMFFGTRAEMTPGSIAWWSGKSLDHEFWCVILMECYDAEAEGDISLGVASYCLVVDPGQWTVYGGVVECELSDDRLILRLTERAAEKLRTPTDMRLGLALDSAKLEVLRRGLRRVLTSGRANAVPQRLVV